MALQVPVDPTASRHANRQVAAREAELERMRGEAAAAGAAQRQAVAEARSGGAAVARQVGQQLPAEHCGC
jgi:hypothetical protein